MKRVILLSLLVLLLSLSLTVCAFAKGEIIFSDDLASFTLNSCTFVRVRNNDCFDEYYYESEKEAKLNEAQGEGIDRATVKLNGSETVASASFENTDGTTLNAVYICSEYLDEYNAFAEGKAERFSVELSYGNELVYSSSQFFGEAVVLQANRIISYEEYYVYSVVEELGVYSVEGSVILCRDEVYFVDYSEIGIKDFYEFYLTDYDELSVWRITDENLVSAFESARDGGYSTVGFDFFFEDNVTEKIVVGVFIFIFAFIPFALFVVFFVCSFRATRVYRRLFRTACVLCAVELVIFTVVTTMILMS